MLRLSESPEGGGDEAVKPLTPKQKKAAETVASLGSATMKEVMYFSGVSRRLITGLVKRGVLEQFERRVFRRPYREEIKKTDEEPELSPEQNRAYENLLEKYRQKEGSASLLYGVTGSGKTLVFMKLIENAVSDGRGVIVLVPEISLTPQTVSRFYRRFGPLVAVFHSGLSVGERLDEWDRIKSGEAKIVVGTRSAVFAPVKDLGIIIIDEEQEHTYKSENSPRYHARDIARYRCAKGGALLVMASATPSVESYFAAGRGRYNLVSLGERYGNATLPEVEIIDMRAELLRGNTSELSEHLLNGLKLNLENGQQSILLLNRRGYNTFISCVECGYVLTCPNCSIALTYHSANGRFVCHYCGYSTESYEECPSCHSNHLRFSGSGTQKIEEVLSQQLPGARVLRMDMDTTVSKYSHETILKDFADQKYDVLIGTQMVAKGLDFPNVTLVGVLSADQMLYTDDFRAAEKTFSLLTQVVGRSGRGKLHGRACIQTTSPENDIIAMAARQDYEAFYDNEIKLRKMLVYPPFCDIYEIGFTGPFEEETRRAAALFSSLLAENIKGAEGLPVRILGPAPAGILKIGSKYRYKIIIKCKDCKAFRKFISDMVSMYYKNRISRRVAAFVAVNPLEMM